MSLLQETEADAAGDDPPLIGGDPVKESAKPPEPDIFEDPLTEEQAAELEKEADKFRQAAFANADCHSWRGKPLYPFSSSREMLWLELRNAVGAPSLADAFGGDPRSMLPDAARILFTCYFPGDDRQRHENQVDKDLGTLTEFRRIAAGDLFELQGRIDRWSNEHIRGDDESELAVALALLIFREARAACPEIAPRVGSGSGGQAAKE